MIVEKTKVRIEQKNVDKIIRYFFENYFDKDLSSYKKAKIDELGPYSFLIKFQENRFPFSVNFETALVYAAVGDEIISGAYTSGSCLKEEDGLKINYVSTNEFSSIKADNTPLIFKEPIKFEYGEWITLARNILEPDIRIPKRMLQEFVI